MKLTRFSVQGFKNITRELMLDDLRDVNVIHGPNSVGKSNLMQAIGLFFLAIRQIDSGTFRIGADELRFLELRAQDIKPVDSQIAMVLKGTVIFDKPIQVNSEFIGELTICAYPSIRSDGTLKVLLGIQTASGEFLEGTLMDSDGKYSGNTRALYRPRIGEYLKKLPRPFTAIDDIFCRIDTNRSTEEQTLLQQNGIDVSLALEMYDSQQSDVLERAQRWRAFQKAMRQFDSVTGAGEMIVTYQRQQQSARLMFETQHARIPLRSLGSGVQQLVALFGRILMSRASIIAIEEPELNLRWNLQKQVSDVLQSLTRDPDSGIRQLFITSHSPAFESGDDFWLMEPGERGPTIARHPRRDLANVLGPGAVEPDLPERAVPTWISSQGVLEVPPRVRKALGLEHGGSVMFEEAPNGVLMRSDQQVLDEMFGATESNAV